MMGDSHAFSAPGKELGPGSHPPFPSERDQGCGLARSSASSFFVSEIFSAFVRWGNRQSFPVVS